MSAAFLDKNQGEALPARVDKLGIRGLPPETGQGRPPPADAGPGPPPRVDAGSISRTGGHFPRQVASGAARPLIQDLDSGPPAREMFVCRGPPARRWRGSLSPVRLAAIRECRSRDAQRVHDSFSADSDLQLASQAWGPAAVEIGSCRVCRSRDAQRVEENVATRLRYSVRIGMRRVWQPSGVQKQSCAEDASKFRSSVHVSRRRVWLPSGVQKQRCAKFASRLRSSVRVGRRRIWQPSGMSKQRGAEGVR